jgi:hypothetical protein
MRIDAALMDYWPCSGHEEIELRQRRNCREQIIAEIKEWLRTLTHLDRQRIAAVIDREVDGLWEPLDVADAVIAELGLQPETVTRYITSWDKA